MKNVVYLLLLSIELTKDVVKCANSETIECTFTDDNAKAIFDASFVPCEEIDLILQEHDDRLIDAVAMELKSNCRLHHLWKITSPNTFKRFPKLTDLSIRGLILIPDDVQAREELKSQLFHVPTITIFEYKDCFVEGTRGKSARWVLPPNISEITISDCDIANFDWEKTAKLKILRITDGRNRIKKIPELGFPSLEYLDISWAVEIEFTIPEIAFFCNMTRFVFDDIKMLRENRCECELLKEWQRYLETENFTLTIDIYNENFKDKPCNAAEEAKIRRASCLSKKPPSLEKSGATVQKKEFDPTSRSFWMFIILGFLILSIIFAILIFSAERVVGSSEPALTEPTELLDEKELEEEEEEDEEEEEEE